MPDEIVHVEATRVEEAPSRPRLLWRAALVVVLLGAIGLAVWLFKSLVLPLVVAALFAAASTAKAQRRRSAWRARGGRVESVGVTTYVRFLAAWFFGILALLPFAVLLGIAAVIGIPIIVVVAILALVATLFGVE